jgi:hypothetical protein
VQRSLQLLLRLLLLPLLKLLHGRHPCHLLQQLLPLLQPLLLPQPAGHCLAACLELPVIAAAAPSQHTAGREHTAAAQAYRVPLAVHPQLLAASMHLLDQLGHQLRCSGTCKANVLQVTAICRSCQPIAAVHQRVSLELQHACQAALLLHGVHQVLPHIWRALVVLPNSCQLLSCSQGSCLAAAGGQAVHKGLVDLGGQPASTVDTHKPGYK